MFRVYLGLYNLNPVLVRISAPKSGEFDTETKHRTFHSKTEINKNTWPSAWVISICMDNKLLSTIYKRTTESTGTLPSALPTVQITINDSLWKVGLLT